MPTPAEITKRQERIEKLKLAREKRIQEINKSLSSGKRLLFDLFEIQNKLLIKKINSQLPLRYQNNLKELNEFPKQSNLGIQIVSPTNEKTQKIRVISILKRQQRNSKICE